MKNTILILLCVVLVALVVAAPVPAIGTFEEWCEMEGVVVFIYALLTHLKTLVEKIDIQIKP